MTKKPSRQGSYQIRVALGFALGLVVVLSAVAVIHMDQRVSSLEIVYWISGSRSVRKLHS